MASHGRRFATRNTKLNKIRKANLRQQRNQVRRLQRQAKRRMENLKQAKIGKTPAMHSYEENKSLATALTYKMTDSFSIEKSKTYLKHFLSMETSTQQGARNVIEKSIKTAKRNKRFVSSMKKKGFDIDDIPKSKKGITKFWGAYHKATDMLNSRGGVKDSDQVMEYTLRFLNDGHTEVVGQEVFDSLMGFASGTINLEG